MKKKFNKIKLSSLMKNDETPKRKTLFQNRINVIKSYKIKNLKTDSCLSGKTQESSIPKITNYINTSPH